jgi:hypothetical protein
MKSGKIINIIAYMVAWKHFPFFTRITVQGFCVYKMINWGQWISQLTLLSDFIKVFKTIGITYSTMLLLFHSSCIDDQC